MEIARLIYGMIVSKFTARSDLHVYARASTICEDKSKTSTMHVYNYRLMEYQQIYNDCLMTSAEKTPRKDICQKNPIIYVF